MTDHVSFPGFDVDEEPFVLENSKYGTLQKFKASAREKIEHPPMKVHGHELVSIKSDETGRVLVDPSHVETCRAKKKDHVTAVDYMRERAAEIEEFKTASLHAVESLAPFKLRRVYGRLGNISAVNLTGLYKNHIIYASSNVVILYDYIENSQKCLQGHRNMITSLQIERKGRFFVTSAAGKKNLMIVWETMTGKPLKYFPNSHEAHGCIYATFTGMNFIFGSVGAEELGKQTICFWNFDPIDKSKKPFLTGAFPKTTSVIRELAFLDKRPEWFAATGDRSVLFGTWVRDRKGDSFCWHKPKLRKSFISKHKRFGSSLWMKNGEWLATSTGAGHIVIWGPPVVLGLEDVPDPNMNIREYQRSFKLCEDGITVFKIYHDYVVIGDEIGIVRFFDHEFKLLRWSKNFGLPPIQTISFHRTEELPEFKKTFREVYNVEGKNKHNKKSRVKDYTFGGKKFRQNSKTTLPRPPMNCPDFIIGVKGGNLYYYHFNESQLDLLVAGTPGPFITCDVCPGSNHVLFSTAKGEVQMYDFKDHKLVFNDKIFAGSHTISTMKFHPMGQIITFGLADGHICFRWNYTWKTAMQPMHITKNQVVRITYTVDGLHLAYYDNNQVVVVIKYLPKGHGWMILGQSRAHLLKIQDIQFFLDPEQNRDRLFSLGYDRHLVEYDIERSSEDTGLYIVKITNLEQTARPMSMIFDGPSEFGIDCITFGNDINKIRMYSYEEEKVRRTVSGPVFGRDKGISRMVEFPTQMYGRRVKKFIVYVVRNKLGIMDTPIDGNPHKYLAVHTHPKEIIEVAVVSDKERIFTIGKHDNSAFVWEASPRAVEATVLMGGSGVAPFYFTLRRHWGGACQDIIRDLDMIFFFLNVKRIDKQTELLTMNRNIRICEISAVCRACGFYPSEYEVGLMMDEARRLKQADQHYTDDFSTEFSFDEFIKLFVNHFYRTTDEDVENAFKVLGFHEPEDEYPYVCRKDFVKYLTNEGEKISEHNFPIFFESMYDVRVPGEFGQVKCHNADTDTSSESSFSLSSSSSSPEPQSKDAADSTSSDSYVSPEDDETNPDQQPAEEGFQFTTEQPAGDQDEDDQDQGNYDNRKSLEPAEPLPDEHETTGQHTTKKSLKLNIPEGRGSNYQIFDDEIPGERDEYDDDEEEAVDDDLIDLPERIDFMYFLEQMIPADSQQAIRWRTKVDPIKDEKPEKDVTKKRQEEEKEFLNTLLKQIVDPNYPIPRKLLNALYAEYYLEHGDFSVPGDLRYPGVPLPGDNWYDEADEEDETVASVSATSLTTAATDQIPGDVDREFDFHDEEGGEGYRPEYSQYSEYGGEGHDRKSGGHHQEDYSTNDEGGELTFGGDTSEAIGSTEFEDLGEEFGAGRLSLVTSSLSHSQRYSEVTGEEYTGEEDNDEDEEMHGRMGSNYSPPFTASEAADTVTTDHRNGYETDGTEEMTDLDNAYEQEDLEFVRNVNESFRPNTAEDHHNVHPHHGGQ